MSTITTTATLPVPDGVGIVGVTVFDEDGAELIARSTAGVVQLHAGLDYGIYLAKLAVPDSTLRGVVVLDDGADNAAAIHFDAPFTDAQRQALRKFAVNTKHRTISDLTADPSEVRIELLTPH